MNNDKYIENRPESWEGEIDLSSNPVLFIPCKLRSKYSIQFNKVGATGTGTISLHGSNDNSNYSEIIDPNSASPITLTMADGTGSDFINNYNGHVHKQLVIKFDGFTGGSCKIYVNFAF